MSRIDVTIPTPDGDCPATLHRPAGSGPWPAVIMYPDAVGVRGTFLDMADRMAGLGYVTLLPNVYYRHGPYPPFRAETVFGDPDERARLGALSGSVSPAMTISDSGAFLDFLDRRPEVAGTGVGTTGYCMGGRASLLVAARHPDRVAAAASFHGGRLAVADDPDSPARFAHQVRAQVYVAAAENDASCPVDQLERLAKAYAEAGVRHSIETYPAAHGFAVPDSPAHDVDAEARHWRALEQLYAGALRG